jgi:hypothetical protein
MLNARSPLIKILKACRWLLPLVLVALTTGRSVVAFNYVTDANGTWWGIQDAASPNVDTGSIRATQTGPGDCLFNACTTPPYSTTINGYAGVKVLVHAARPPRMNGEIMRGYGLAFDGANRFTSTQSIDLGGVVISRSVYIRRSRWPSAARRGTEIRKPIRPICCIRPVSTRARSSTRPAATRPSLPAMAGWKRPHRSTVRCR